VKLVVWRRQCVITYSCHNPNVSTIIMRIYNSKLRNNSSLARLCTKNDACVCTVPGKRSLIVTVTHNTFSFPNPSVWFRFSTFKCFYLNISVSLNLQRSSRAAEEHSTSSTHVYVLQLILLRRIAIN